jgi:hypothetical protein
VCIQSVIKELTKRKGCKRQYIYIEETLIVSKVLDLITKRESSSYKEGKTPAKRVRAKRRCSCCSKVRHNPCTCKVEIENADNSKESKV